MKKNVQIVPAKLDIHVEEVRRGRYLRVLHANAANSLTSKQLSPDFNSTADNNILKTELCSISRNNVQNLEVSPSVSNERTVSSCNRVILFLHGVGGSAETWEKQIDHFNDYDVIAVDCIGHGHSKISAVKEDYSFHEILNDLLTVFDKYSCATGTNVIVGHSYGSCFAAAIARNRPRFVHKLVLISGGAPVPLYPQEGCLNSMPLCCLYICRDNIQSTFRRQAFSKHSNSASLVKQAFNVPTQVIKYTMDMQIWPEGDEDFFRWLMVPTLLIHGQDDLLVSLDEVNHMHATVPNSRLEVIADAGHMVMMEKPIEVNNLVRKFIEEK